jgi:hypothetical protein
MIPTTSVVVALALAAVTFAAHAHEHSHSLSGVIVEGVAKGSIDALHHYADSKEQQQQQAQYSPREVLDMYEGRSHYTQQKGGQKEGDEEEEDDTYEDDDEEYHYHYPHPSPLETLYGGSEEHEHLHYGGHIAESTIPAAHFHSKHSHHPHHDSAVSNRDDDDASSLEARNGRGGAYGELGHLAVKYSGKLVESAVPAIAAHFESKHSHKDQQNPNNNGDTAVSGRDFEETLAARSLEGWGAIFREAGEAYGKTFGGGDSHAPSSSSSQLSSSFPPAPTPHHKREFEDEDEVLGRGFGEFDELD